MALNSSPQWVPSLTPIVTSAMGCIDYTKYGTKPIRYVMLHDRDRRSAASLRHRNRAVTTVLVFDEKPYPVIFRTRVPE